MIENTNPRNYQECDSSFSTDPNLRFGFVVDGLTQIDSKYKCIFCSLIMNDPVQLTECGHRSCRNCFDVRAADSRDGNVTCTCEDCHMVTNKNNIMTDRAFKRDLDALQTICMYRSDKRCSWTGRFADYQSHLDENHAYFICSKCAQPFSSQILFSEHEEKTCPTLFQTCFFGELCTKQRIRTTEFQKHLTSKEHQEIINKLLLGEVHLSVPSNPEPVIESDTNNKELEEAVNEKVNKLSSEIQRVRDATLQLNDNISHLNEDLKKAIQELNEQHVSVNGRIPIKQSIQPSQDALQKSIEYVEQLCNNREHISTDGTVLWRVDGVSEKIADAQSERRTSIYSPAFYTSPTGYKMRGRLFLFGDGSARRTHMSLFFCIMKGEYDAILPWPFHYKVTFCLLDQTNGNRHIIDSFYPDVKSNSFQRPEQEANIASGIPKFFPLPMLLQDDNQYVREDTLYIKIIVSMDEKPKLILPFILTLNPALPLHVQENLINQEIKKQQQ